MLHYRVNDFISMVLSCSQTTTLAALLDMFEVESCDARTEPNSDRVKQPLYSDVPRQANCDRIVVLNEKEYPVGLLDLAGLMSKLLGFVSHKSGSESTNYLQQPILSLDNSLLQPIQTISATKSIEEFNQVLNSPGNPSNAADWVVIDANRKYLGVLDSARLLKHLTKSSVSTNNTSDDLQNMNKNTIGNSNQASKPSDARQRKKGNRVTRLSTNDVPQDSIPQSHSEQKREQYQPLVQLLERLPWALTLQTNNGEVVTRNPAWWKQLGMLKDPEGVRREVEAILSPKAFSEKRSLFGSLGTSPVGVSTISSEMEKNLPFLSIPGSSTNFGSGMEEDTTESNLGGSCFFNDELGTCTCVVEFQTGQERVWQFAKIPLDSTEWQVIHDLWLILATDVTDVQLLSKELAAKNADLIQLNRLKDEFLACISHELKTPLTAVLGLSRLLVDQQLGELNERQARYAGLTSRKILNGVLTITSAFSFSDFFC
ncbi:hybrid sensor histidine kinase/response regulator, partial [Brunnivagina elsteri CCALA 953]